MLNRHLSVDPGIESGWAVWQSQTWDQLCAPTLTGVIKPKKSLSWEERFKILFNEFEDLFREYNIESVICEYPQFFNNAGGEMVAKRGDLGKLYIVVGGLMVLASQYDADFIPAPVMKWKGQLSKRVVCKRIVKKVKNLPSSMSPLKKGEGSHDWDAVGIGLWSKGCF